MTKRELTYGDLLPQLLAYQLRRGAPEPKLIDEPRTIIGVTTDFEVVTRLTPDCITQEVFDLALDARERARASAVHVIQLRDAHIVKALTALGWTPPKEAAT